MEKGVTKIDEDSNGSVATISYKLKFIDRARFMATSLSNLVDNLTKGIHNIKLKDCDCFPEYESVKCLSCNKRLFKKNYEELKKCCKNTFKFSNKDINKFILFSRKGIYPYEYSGEWEKMKKLYKNEKLQRNVIMEDITDAYYIHAKRC